MGSGIYPTFSGGSGTGSGMGIYPTPIPEFFRIPMYGVNIVITYSRLFEYIRQKINYSIE